MCCIFHSCTLCNVLVYGDSCVYGMCMYVVVCDAPSVANILFGLFCAFLHLCRQLQQLSKLNWTFAYLVVRVQVERLAHGGGGGCGTQGDALRIQVSV